MSVSLNDIHSGQLMWVTRYKFVTVIPQFKMFLPQIPAVYKSHKGLWSFQGKVYLFIY
jgi:hypothetical protein